MRCNVALIAHTCDSDFMSHGPASHDPDPSFKVPIPAVHAWAGRRHRAATHRICRIRRAKSRGKCTI